MHHNEKSPMMQTKIPCATDKTPQSQINQFKKKTDLIFSITPFPSCITRTFAFESSKLIKSQWKLKWESSQRMILLRETFILKQKRN